MRPAAVVVTYRSDVQIDHFIEGLSGQVQTLIIVRNQPSSSFDAKNWAIDEQPIRVRVLDNEENKGIATALNQGFRMARSMGHDTALALDQDSRAEVNMVQTLDRHRRMSGDNKIAIVAPNVIERQTSTHARYLVPRSLGFIYKRQPCSDGLLDNVTIVISSGALYDLSIHQAVGGFREDYFIDYVDTEYCLRLRRSGYHIKVACNANLHHNWGQSQEVSLLGFNTRPTFHPPRRWYYISRNRVPTIREYGLRFPHWLLFDLTMAVWWFVRMLLFEDQRLHKVKAFLLGTWDGILGRMGPCERDF